MEVRSLQGSLRGFGAKPTVAYLGGRYPHTGRSRQTGQATIFGLGMVLALIAIPIPIVHFILVPGAILIGTVLGPGEIGAVRDLPKRQGALSLLRPGAELQRDGPVPAAQEALLLRLSAAAAAGRGYHRTAALPHMNPDPKAVITSRSPRWSRPSRTHSSRAMGMVAAVVLPYHMMLL